MDNLPVINPLINSKKTSGWQRSPFFYLKTTRHIYVVVNVVTSHLINNKLSKVDRSYPAWTRKFRIPFLLHLQTTPHSSNRHSRENS